MRPEIDFSRLKPENQDDFSKTIALELQASGKVVNDNTIGATEVMLSAQAPKAEEEFKNEKIRKGGE